MTSFPSESKKDIFSLEQVLEVVESMQDAFLLCDKNWNIILVNKNYERITKKSREDILGKNLWELLEAAKDPQLKFWSAFHQAAEKKSAVTF
jgi:PAS domain S-box-containing protein